MEDEIDLRIYIEPLLRRWYWIVGLALVAAVAGLLISLALPATYKASAVVLVTEPRYQMQFDPRFGTEQIQPAYKAFPTLATSDSILQAVIEAVPPSSSASGEQEWSLKALRGMVEATSAGDPSLVVLTVTASSAERAAVIANAWADVLVQQGNEIYGGSEQDVVFFETQQQQAAEALDQAEAALVEFKARDESNILQADLDSLQTTQTDYLRDQRAIAYIIQDIQGLRQQMAEAPADQAASLADSLTVLFLQMKAFNASASPSLQLQVEDSATISERSPSEQVAFLDDLAATLEAKSAEIDTRLAELRPRILELQQEIQELSVENSRLTRAQSLAQETYVTLARKVDEVRITTQEENGALQVGSFAAVPQAPAGPRKLFNTAVAGALGLVAGVAAVWIVEFWQRARDQGAMPNDG
ncbi:MAG: Wzz/FepE/Etk N-terminal domain-containing protein [Anaerolineae bacterium]